MAPVRIDFGICDPRRFLLGIPPCFPPLGFTLIVNSLGTPFSPVGGLLLFSFLRELHRLGKLWSKSCGNSRVSDKERGKRSSIRGETAGIGELGFGDSGTETGNAQVGIGPCVEDGYFRTETDDARVGGVPRVDAMSGLGLGAAGWDDGDRSGNQGKLGG